MTGSRLDMGDTIDHVGEDLQDSVVSPAASSADPVVEMVSRWLKWPIVALERIPLPFPLIIIVLGLLAFVEQLLEYSMDIEALGGAATLSPLRLIVFPLLVIYILGNFYFLKRFAVRSLADLRPSVMVDDDIYDEHIRKLIAANGWVELVLLLVSLLVVLGIFVGLKADLLNTSHSLPDSLPISTFIILMYSLLGWLLLEIVYHSIRQARALDGLAHLPLKINVFDLTRLLPFGRLGLIQSLPIVGIVLVPLILFGAPTQGGYLVISISVVSFLSLFVPLWGVHQQIDQAQERTLEAIHDQLQDINNRLLSKEEISPADLSAFSARVKMLVDLRSTILQTPTWPFKDSATAARAIIAVTSPLVYFILNELIRTFVLPILSGAK